MKYISGLLVLLFIISCASDLEKTSPTVEMISESVYASGVVKSNNQYQVFATVNGVVLEVFITEGDLVKRGDTLMEIRNELADLNIENALLAVSQATRSVNEGKLRELRAAIDLALRRMQNDSLLLVRQRSLHSQGIGSKVDLETRELNYQTSLTNYEVALLNYQNLERDLNFSVDQSENNLKISRALAADNLILAEADGKVYKVLIEQGELVNPVNPVAVIGDATSFLVELQVDEYDIARIQVGQEVLFSLDSYQGEVFKGRVEKVEPYMDENSRSFTVLALFDTPPPVLYPNLSVEANIVIRSKEEALTIPRSYLVQDSLVIVHKDEERKVVVGMKDYNRVEIISGLTTEDVIYKIDL